MIAQLIATPPGLRETDAHYEGPLGEQLNAIISALLAPPGQAKNNGKK